MRQKRKRDDHQNYPQVSVILLNNIKHTHKSVNKNKSKQRKEKTKL